MNAKPFTIGVLTSGGDAPGMNAAIRAVVRTAMANNANVIGIANGYEGLLNGEFRSMGARDVGGILQRGGTFCRRAAVNVSRNPEVSAKRYAASMKVELTGWSPSVEMAHCAAHMH